jgi:hypothetical protein
LRRNIPSLLLFSRRGQSPTRAYRSNLAHEIITESIENRKNLGGRGFGFRKKEDIRIVIPD